MAQVGVRLLGSDDDPQPGESFVLRVREEQFRFGPELETELFDAWQAARLQVNTLRLEALPQERCLEIIEHLKANWPVVMHVWWILRYCDENMGAYWERLPVEQVRHLLNIQIQPVWEAMQEGENSGGIADWAGGPEAFGEGHGR